MTPEQLTELFSQAPAVGAVLLVVVLFLRHIRAADKAQRESDAANRAVMKELTEALTELRLELREDRRR